MNDLTGMTFDGLIQEYITEKLMETLAVIGEKEEFKKDRDKFNNVVEYSNMDLNSKRIVYQYIKSTIDSFFDAGFRQGIEFTQILLEREYSKKGDNGKTAPLRAFIKSRIKALARFIRTRYMAK